MGNKTKQGVVTSPPNSKVLIMAWPKEKVWPPAQKVQQVEEEWLGHVTSVGELQRLPLSAE